MKARYWACLGVKLGPVEADDIKRTLGPAPPSPSSKAGGRRPAWRDGPAAGRARRRARPAGRRRSAVCLAKVHWFRGCKSHPATLAPAGSTRGGSGGDEWSEAPRETAPLGGQRAMRAAARANTEQASKVSDVGADPPAERGRPPSTGKRARHAPADPTGVRVAARMAENRFATREVCPGDHGRQPAGRRRTREGQRRPGQMAEGSVRPRTPGNAGRGKGP